MSRREDQFDDKIVYEDVWDEQEVLTLEDEQEQEEGDDNFYDFVDLIRIDIADYLDQRGLPIGQKLRSSDLVKLLCQLE